MYTEVFSGAKEGARTSTDRPSKTQKELRGDTSLLNLIRAGIDTASGEDGWAALSAVGSYVNKTSTDFDPRNYGYGKLNELVSTIGLFDLERRGTHFYVREPRKGNDL